MIHSNCSKSTHYKCPYCIVLYYINGIMIPHTNSLPSQLTLYGLSSILIDNTLYTTSPTGFTDLWTFNQISCSHQLLFMALFRYNTFRLDSRNAVSWLPISFCAIPCTHPSSGSD